MGTIKDNEILWCKLKDMAIIPTKKSEDMGYDIYACFEEDYLIIEPHQTALVPTGIGSAFSEKYGIVLEERSSVGKLGIKRNAGVFDSSYRGEWLVLLYNTTDRPFIIAKSEDLVPLWIRDEANPIIYPYNKAIVQAVVHEVPQLVSKEVSREEFGTLVTERGTGKFGSSGK